MAKAPQMKIPIGAETSDFDKGARKVKQEMRDLNKVSSDAFAAIGNALGVDVGRIEQFSSALSGLGRDLAKTGAEGTTAFTKIGAAITSAGASIAGIGIAAAVVAFKTLKDEADAFKDTVEGANIEMATAAYVSTYKQVLYDYRKEIGNATAELDASGKKVAGTFWSTVTTFLRAARSSNLELPGNNTQVLDEAWRQIGDATQKADEAARLTREIYQLERKRKEQAVELSQIDADIADKMNIARDASISVSERQKAVADIEDLLLAKKTKAVTLESKLARLYEQRSELADDSVADADAVLAQQQREYDVARAITLEENALLRLKNQINKAIKEEQQIREHWNDAHANAPGLVESDGLMLGSVQVPVTPIIPPKAVHEFKEHLVMELGDGITIGIAIDLESVEQIRDISDEVKSVLQDLAVGVGESIGEMMGALVSGEDPWGAFAKAALSAFGDMAISVGKIAIEMGLASEGIKAALKLGNPYIAIAAGVALVALGTAVKAGLANIANGDYSAGANVATTNSASAYSSEYEQREVTVNVTGTLEADGDQLVAVINNTNKKAYYGT